jgi:RNA polymerase sigma-70 factor (ECF subfamily)
MMDESALLEAVAAGDRACFERLYSSYERRIYHYARSIVRDTGTAEEVVIDTMMAVWDGAGRFSGTSRLSTWILGIARHKALDAVRRRGRSGRLGKPIALEDAADIPADEPTPDALADSGSTRTAMQGALAHLSSEHREILYLVFYEDLPYEDIARLLALPVNTVKTRVYYAKQNLRSHIERHTDMELQP